jgi:uncharacterized NAD(P)/FAD-binding protein YdhS
MSILPEDPAHFIRWIATTGVCRDDPEAALPDGRLFPRRAVFGTYVAEQLSPLLCSGRIVHLRTEIHNREWHRGVYLGLPEYPHPHQAFGDDAGEGIGTQCRAVHVVKE